MCTPSNRLTKEAVCPNMRQLALDFLCLRPDDLRVIKELPIKAARDCCFSNGGQYFAAVNGNTGGSAGMTASEWLLWCTPRPFG